MPIVISIENLSKSYRLGSIGTSTLSRDLNQWWAKVATNPTLTSGSGRRTSRTAMARSSGLTGYQPAGAAG